MRKKGLLTLKLKVVLPDETTGSRTPACKDAVVLEEEEQQRARAAEEVELNQRREKMERIKKQEEDVMNTRKAMVENLSAISAGSVPPALKAEIDKMPPEELRSFMVRLEGRVRKGDTVDQLLDKLPSDVIDIIAASIRAKLGLAPLKVAEPTHPKEPAKDRGASKEPSDSRPIRPS